MGCGASRVDNEGKISVAKERKRLMKQLLGFRKEFADSQLVYLRSLKNVGVTLRQFTESESLELEDTVLGPVLPPHPPPLPPPPPPPPAFVADLSASQNKEQLIASEEEIIDTDVDESHSPPPPSVFNSSWEYWDPFGSSLPHCEQGVKPTEQLEEEAWEEANCEFEAEDQDEDRVTSVDDVNKLPLEKENDGLIDDNFSTVSWHSKDNADAATVIRNNQRTLTSIIRELDDYFVKASDGGKDVSLFVDISVGDDFLRHSPKEKSKRTNSSKVFSSLAWSWSSKSLISTKDSPDTCGPNEPCGPGAHCATLEKLYAAEQELCRDMKEEEVTRLELERKSTFLQKLDEEDDQESTRIEKIRLIVESLQSRLLFLQESIMTTCSTMLKVIDEELHPQLIALTSGLISMWQNMYENHQVQSHIAQHLNLLCDQQKMEPTTEYHQHAAAQLKNEITLWYTSFSRLMKFQRDYVSTLNRWIKLTESLEVDGLQRQSLCRVPQFSERWLNALDKLSDTMALEAIKSLLSAIDSIVIQQQEEVRLHRRSDKLERKLQREYKVLGELEQKFPGSCTNEEKLTGSDSKHPLSIKRAKIEVLKKQVDDEKAKYVNSIHVTRAMILNNLQTSLPSVFRALRAFSSAYAQSLEEVLTCGEQDDDVKSPPRIEM